ncbi:hypothetical protein C2S52_018503 [Perilla frutescens var. hirtella]|nr:hypothetical protein C2S52_018503 [Perilla frutescens var. hirtella]KAH6812202.1 hypothetical protein C2S51_025964 [Perilla frutescens var. frutescens]
MEGEERGALLPIYDHHLNISFSAPHQMGFLQFEDHTDQVLSFLAATAHHPLQGGTTATAAKPTTTNTNGSLGLNHNDELVNNRPSWGNDDQVEEWFGCREEAAAGEDEEKAERAKILFPDKE